MNLSRFYLAPANPQRTLCPRLPGDGADPRALRSRFSRVGVAFTLFLVVGQLASSLLFLLAQTVLPSFRPTLAASAILSNLGLYLCAMPLSLLVLRRVPEGPARQGITYAPRQTAYLAAISFALLFFTNLLSTALNTLLARYTNANITDVTDLVMEDGNLISVFFFLVLIAPALEEFFFRGVLLSRLRGCGDRFAILTCGLLFGFAHMNLKQFFYAFAVGCFFSYLTLRTGTIRLSILLHALINFLGSFLPLLLQRFSSGAQQLFVMGELLFAGVGLALFFSNLRGKRLPGSLSGFTERESARLFYTSPGGLLCVAAGILGLAVSTFVL